MDAPIWSGGSQATPTWSGEVDSTAPRVTLCKALVSGTTYRYVTLAQDYNLVETNLTTPCGLSATIAKGYFNSPWYLGSTSSSDPKLYQLTASCQLDGSPPQQSRACDSAGNCTTANVTTGGACTAILSAQGVAAQAESPGRTQCVRGVCAGRRQAAAPGDRLRASGADHDPVHARRGRWPSPAWSPAPAMSPGSTLPSAAPSAAARVRPPCPSRRQAGPSPAPGATCTACPRVRLR